MSPTRRLPSTAIFRFVAAANGSEHGLFSNGERPFGGYKQSGFGRELSIDTLELYLETKGVLFSTSPKPFNPFGL